MNFTWVHFLDLASELAVRGDEASQRSAISRAYYAAFHGARGYVRSKFPDVRLSRGGDEHFHVWDCLKKGSRRQEVAVGTYGKRLYDARRRADYDLEGLNFPRSTRDALSGAKSILNALAALDQLAPD